MSPVRAILLPSPGRKPWVRHLYTFFLSPVGAAQPQSKCLNTRAVSVAPKGALFTFIYRYPGFHLGLCPHSTLGCTGVSCLKALIMHLNFDALTLSYIYLQLKSTTFVLKYRLDSSNNLKIISPSGALKDSILGGRFFYPKTSNDVPKGTLHQSPITKRIAQGSRLGL